MRSLDTNPRTAGRTRPNARAERQKFKADWQDDRQPLGELQDWTADTLVLLLDSPEAPTAARLQAAATALGARLSGPDATIRQAAWELGVRWAARPFSRHPGRFADAATRVAVECHAGWLAVELLAAPPRATPSDRLGRIGRLLGALALGAAVVLRPATQELRLLTPDVAHLLGEGRVADAFGGGAEARAA